MKYAVDIRQEYTYYIIFELKLFVILKILQLAPKRCYSSCILFGQGVKENL